MAADLLLAALRAAPHRHRLPPLPADAAAAQAAGARVAVAFAIEALRDATARGAVPPRAAQQVFVDGLAELLREAVAPNGGDPAFRAFVMRAEDARIDEFVELGNRAGADHRATYRVVNAVAHPAREAATPRCRRAWRRRAQRHGAASTRSALGATVARRLPGIHLVASTLLRASDAGCLSSAHLISNQCQPSG